jgi:serine/threonine protein kinase
MQVPNSGQDRLQELLLRWEQLYVQGRNVPAAELCCDCPDLVTTLEQEISRRKEDRRSILDTTRAIPVTRAADEPLPDLAGARYRPLRFHAAGGLGRVFLARDEELGRDVALKRIQGQAAERDDCRQRFVDEAEITGRLEHPGIVPVYGMGMDASGQPFYAMRFIQGTSLKDALGALHTNRDPQGPELRPLLQCLVAVCNAVAYAHSRGVVHRDLKPANVMLGKYGETLVVDWGLAKVVGRPEAQPTSEEETLLPPSGAQDGRTVAGQAMGTPGYMSPEQANGRWDEVGPASDIFSLGATLYHVLAGQPPYVGSTALAAARLGRYERPRRLDRRVSPALEAVCLKALAAAPADRYSTALDLARDLERWLAEEPVSCHRESLSTQLGRWARRHRTLVTSGGVAVLLIAVGCVAGLFLQQRARYEQQQQALEYQQARQRQLAEHRLQLEHVAQADLTLALVEAQAGRFASAEQILYKAGGTLRGEPDLAALRDRIEASRDRLARMAAFYRTLGRAEYLTAQVSDATFAGADDTIIAQCEAALKELGVVGGAREWWNHLPTDELLPRQVQRLQEDTIVALGILALWRVKQGLMKFDSIVAIQFQWSPDQNAQHAYRAAQEDFGLVQAYYEAVHRRRMAAADCLDLFCRWRLKQPLPSAPLKLEPANATDAYFLGLIHAFLGDVKVLPPWDRVFMVLSRDGVPLTGLAYDSLLPTAERLLRTAAELDPEHYWAHFWLGRCLVLRKDYAAAELAFNTCVGLRPDYPIGYTQRGLALVAEADRLEAQAHRDGLPSPLDTTASWIGLATKPRLYPGDALLAVSLFAADHTLHQRAQAGSRARRELLARGLKGLDEGLTRLPDEAAIHWQRAVCLARLGRTKESLTAQTSAAELLACQGQVGLHASEGLTGVVVAFRRNVEAGAMSEPNTPVVEALRALACLAAGDDAAAARAATAALAKEPRNGPALAVRGVLRLREQKVADALRDLEAVPARGLGEMLATFGRAMAYEKAGDWPRVRLEYDRLLRGTGSVDRSGAVPGWLQLQAYLGRARAARAMDLLDETRTALADARAIDAQTAERLKTRLLPDAR